MRLRAASALLLLCTLVGCPKNEFIPESSSSETSSSETTGEPIDTTAAVTETSTVDCGNGMVDGSEVCDDGEGNGNDYSATKHCNADCDGYAPHCGDDTCQPAEETPANCPLDCANPACGNGITEAGEQCDAGVDGTPTDSAECDDDCTTPMCGDGNENTAADEECDDGNNVDSDACLGTCKAASCGDTVVHEGVEACDDGNDVETDDCDMTCKFIEHRRVFVSSTEYEGDFGGLAGDTICQVLGRAPNYKAWLSDDTLGPADSLDTNFTGVYELTNGEFIAKGWADLTDGELGHAIDQTEAGETIEPSAVWSNTKADGTPLGTLHCANWTSSGLNTKGSWGASDSTMTQWSDAEDDQACSSAARLYCFEDL